MFKTKYECGDNGWASSESCTAKNCDTYVLAIRCHTPHGARILNASEPPIRELVKLHLQNTAISVADCFEGGL
jgi:hypothetical protein